MCDYCRRYEFRIALHHDPRISCCNFLYLVVSKHGLEAPSLYSSDQVTWSFDIRPWQNAPLNMRIDHRVGRPVFIKRLVPYSSDYQAYLSLSYIVNKYEAMNNACKRSLAFHVRRRLVIRPGYYLPSLIKFKYQPTGRPKKDSVLRS